MLKICLFEKILKKFVRLGYNIFHLMKRQEIQVDLYLNTILFIIMNNVKPRSQIQFPTSNYLRRIYKKWLFEWVGGGGILISCMLIYHPPLSSLLMISNFLYLLFLPTSSSPPPSQYCRHKRTKKWFFSESLLPFTNPRMAIADQRSDGVWQSADDNNCSTASFTNTQWILLFHSVIY